MLGREMDYPCLLTGLDGCDGKIVYAGFGLSVRPRGGGGGGGGEGGGGVARETACRLRGCWLCGFLLVSLLTNCYILLIGFRIPLTSLLRGWLSPGIYYYYRYYYYYHCRYYY